MKRIPAAVVRDAVNVCESIYRMNAPYATGYVFNCDEKGKSVYKGMFCSDLREVPDWDGFIRFGTVTLQDNMSGKTYSLANTDWVPTQIECPECHQIWDTKQFVKHENMCRECSDKASKSFWES
jgi:hypothetical protein